MNGDIGLPAPNHLVYSTQSELEHLHPVKHYLENSRLVSHARWCAQ